MTIVGLKSGTQVLTAYECLLKDPIKAQVRLLITDYILEDDEMDGIQTVEKLSELRARLQEDPGVNA